MHRRNVGILLLLTSILPFVGIIGVYKYQQLSIRHKAKQHILSVTDRSDLVFFRFQKNDVEKLEWERSDEFEFEGNMYDVVETYQKGDSIYYWCWPDKQETALNRQLDRLLADLFEQDETRKNTSHTFLLLIKTPFINWAESTYIATKSTTIFRIADRQSLPSIFSAPPVPPPQKVG